MKKILITGATGFIGSHLAEYFVEKGYQVIGYDRYNPNNNWGWLEGSKYKSEIEIILGDIRDYDSVAKSVKICDTVLHLAALNGIPYSYVSPLAYIKTNIEGTYNILEASKNSEISDVLITSTSEVYGTAQYIPMDEDHPLVGQSPYAASKISADQLAMSYFRSFDLPVKIVRPFNVYGPRQSPRAVIPSIILQLLINEDYNIKIGDTSPTRDFTYVNDICSSYLELLKSENHYGEVINVGMGKEISISDLIKNITNILDIKDFTLIKENKRYRPKKSEVNRLFCDNKKLIQNTNWKAKYNLKEGLENTIKWFRENKSFFKAEFYNI